MRSFLTCAVEWILTAAVLGAAEVPAPPTFIKKPTASREGDKVKIDFAVDRETDVAVYIENGKGEVVRHLVAGCLGKNPPEPLKAGALDQSLEWDLRDDDGRPAAGGPFRVRVGLGLKASWGGLAFAGKNETGPNHLENVKGLAAAADGRLYVLDDRNNHGCFAYGGSALHIFRRNGSYERTIKPFPADIAPEKIKATGAFADKEGRLIPLIHRPLSMTFYPCEETLSSQQFALTPDDQALLAVVPPTFWGPWTPCLALVNADGGIPGESFAGPELGRGYAYCRSSKDGKEMMGGPALAVGADGKSAYLIGIGPKGQNLPVVHRVPLPARGPMEIFFGSPDKAGSDEKSLDDPRGIAADGKGLLFVSDGGNNRIVVLKEADKGFVGSLPVEAPGWVAVHPKSSEVYVCSRESIVKVSGWKNPKELSRLALPPRGTTDARFRWSFALDGSTEPAVLWVGRSRCSNRFPALLRCEESGNRFGDLKQAGYFHSAIHRNPSVDPFGKEISCSTGGAFAEKLLVQNDATGEFREIQGVMGQGSTCALGPEGQIYRTDFSWGGVARYDREGRPLPFPESGPEPLGEKKDATKNAGRLACHAGSGVKPNRPGVCVDRRGNVYVLTRWGKHEFHLDLFAPDGSLLRTVLDRVNAKATKGPRVDLAGNVYIADAIGPAGKPRFPEAFVPHLASEKIRKWYEFMYGSVIKFGPEGGLVYGHANLGGEYGYKAPPARSDPKLKIEEVNGEHNKPATLQGALWWRPGFSSLFNMGDSPESGDGGCLCTPNDFDVDDFGRVFYPDQGRFRIVVLDTAGNEMARFGDYGNQDCCGPESYVLDPREKHYRQRRADDPGDLVSPFAKPEVPLGWINGVGVSDRHAYVADGLNRRMLRVKLDYAAAETAAVP